MNDLLTIGHSNHTLDHFVSLLGTHNISAVADVRSSPYSQYAPQFNKETLQAALGGAGIGYVFLGDQLGARRREESCYVGGQTKFQLIAELPTFRDGLARLMQGIERYRAALLCSEADPITCHRTVLICRELTRLRPDLRISHILGDGSVESDEDAGARLVQIQKLQPQLFGDLTTKSGLVKKAYELQAERIAYKKVPTEA